MTEFELEIADIKRRYDERVAEVDRATGAEALALYKAALAALVRAIEAAVIRQALRPVIAQMAGMLGVDLSGAARPNA